MNLEKVSILIVDDSEENRLILEELCNNIGYLSQSSENGKLALEFIKKTPPTLILLDIEMPVMNGYELLEIIKKDPLYNDIPVIVVSAVEETESVIRCLKLGAEDYLPKPFEPDILQVRIQNSLLRLRALQIEKKLNKELTKLFAELTDEKKKSDQLLLNILPLKIANELKESGKTVPEVFENVTVYFSDVVGFTEISTHLEPDVLIGELNDIFTAFDNIIEKNGCERIKTIGDAYMCVCGLPTPDEKHAENIVASAIEILKYLKDRNEKSKIQWNIRVGIHTGKIVGGVVGIKKYIYDLFGDTINTAARMESNSEPMKINVSEQTYSLVKDKFQFIERESIEVKGKGKMKMYFVRMN